MFQKIEKDAGAIHKSEPHTEGVEETITVIEGQVTVEAGEMRELVVEGETIVFSGNQHHLYENAASGRTVLHLILQYR